MVAEAMKAGAMIRAARLAKRLTMGELASELGVSVSYISEVEHGRRHLAHGIAEPLAARLELSAQELLAATARERGNVSLPTKSAEQREFMAVLARQWESLAPADLAALRDQLLKKGARGGDQ